mgnify:CR=1 FL=1
MLKWCEHYLPCKRITNLTLSWKYWNICRLWLFGTCSYTKHFSTLNLREKTLGVAFPISTRIHKISLLKYVYIQYNKSHFFRRFYRPRSLIFSYLIAAHYEIYANLLFNLYMETTNMLVKFNATMCVDSWKITIMTCEQTNIKFTFDDAIKRKDHQT